MGTTPEITNEAAAFFDGLVQVMITGDVDAVEAYIAASPASFLEAPVIDLLTNWAISGLAQSVSKQSKIAIAIAVINVQTEQEQSAVGKAVAAWNAAQTSGDPNAIAAANTQFDNALGGLIHWDGSGPTS